MSLVALYNDAVVSAKITAAANRHFPVPIARWMRLASGASLRLEFAFIEENNTQHFIEVSHAQAAIDLLGAIDRAIEAYVKEAFPEEATKKEKALAEEQYAKEIEEKKREPDVRFIDLD